MDTLMKDMEKTSISGRIPEFYDLALNYFKEIVEYGGKNAQIAILSLEIINACAQDYTFLYLDDLIDGLATATEENSIDILYETLDYMIPHDTSLYDKIIDIIQ